MGTVLWFFVGCFVFFYAFAAVASSGALTGCVSRGHSSRPLNLTGKAGRSPASKIAMHFLVTTQSIDTAALNAAAGLATCAFVRVNRRQSHVAGVKWNFCAAEMLIDPGDTTG